MIMVHTPGQVSQIIVRHFSIKLKQSKANLRPPPSQTQTQEKGFDFSNLKDNIFCFCYMFIFCTGTIFLQFFIFMILLKALYRNYFFYFFIFMILCYNIRSKGVLEELKMPQKFFKM